MSDKDGQTRVGGILSEIIDLGEQRGGAPAGDRARVRHPISGVPCPECGSPVTSKPLLSGRVWRCSNCAKTWAGPPAATAHTVDPAVVPVLDPVPPVDHFVADARPFRVKVTDKE